MSSYTMQLKAYIEMFSQYDENLKRNERIEIGRKHLFDFDYPIFDENYRKTFETNFIKNFYIREIGFETEELFKMRLETWLNINMPYFNNLFESELLDYDPLTNAKMEVTHQKETDKDINQTSETDGTSSSNSSGESKDDGFSRKVGSDNPDSRLQLQTEDGKGVIEYASEIDENKLDNKSSSSAETSDTTQAKTKANQKDSEFEEFVQNRVGKIGVQTYAKMVMDYREALLRVEVQIHKELQQLFMLVY